jgi:GAF domain-containing protein
MSDPSPLGESLAALSRFFVSDSTIKETLERVTELCQKAIPATAFIGITLMIEGRPRTAIYTDESSPEVDQTQYDTGRGPCLDAFRHNQVYRIDSTLADGPWPEFRKAAASRDILSTLSVPLSMEHGSVGALNLYSLAESGFDEHDQEMAAQFASHAAVVLANADAYWDARELSERLDQAMQSRSIIEQAKGMLMGAQRRTADEAFDILVKASQRENIKLRDIAARIVEGAARGEPPPL